MPDEPPDDATPPPLAEGGVPERQDGAAALADAVAPPPEVDAAEAYRQRACLAEDRLNEVLTAYRALKKENEDYRERQSRNLERKYAQRRERLLLKFIDILDNLDRALEAAQMSYAGEPLLEGMILVRTQLLQTLQEEGLERIPVLGLAFDPHVSESVGTQPVGDPDQDHVVVKELMRGYCLNGRIARVSRVLIGVYQEGAVYAKAVPEGPMVGRPKAPEDAEAAPALAEIEPEPEGPSIEEIITRAESHEALFPTAFEPSPPHRDEE